MYDLVTWCWWRSFDDFQLHSFAKSFVARLSAFPVQCGPIQRKHGCTEWCYTRSAGIFVPLRCESWEMSLRFPWEFPNLRIPGWWCNGQENLRKKLAIALGFRNARVCSSSAILVETMWKCHRCVSEYSVHVRYSIFVPFSETTD